MLRRSYKMAHAEYTRLLAAAPSEPLPLLCLAVCQLQLIMARRTASKGERSASALLGIGWMQKYAEARAPAHASEPEYNMGRALQHLGLEHLAVASYEKVGLGLGFRRGLRLRLRLGSELGFGVAQTLT